MPREKLVLSSLSHYPGSGLAGVLALALVLPELEVEIPLRIFDPFHGLHGNLELAIAKSADPDSWDCAEPFDYPKIPL